MTTEGKHARQIIKKYRPLTPELEKIMAESPVVSTPLLWLDDEVSKGAFYLECHWLWSMPATETFSADESHSHDFDEVLGFTGSRQENPHDLGAEIDIWLEDEKYTITESCLIFIPRGMKHLPMTFKRIDSPFMFFTTGNGKMYRREGDEES